jgi:hypothetical protein
VLLPAVAVAVAVAAALGDRRDGIRSLLADRRLLVFSACCARFALSNTAMPPLEDSRPRGTWASRAQANRFVPSLFGSARKEKREGGGR